MSNTFDSSDINPSGFASPSGFMIELSHVLRVNTYEGDLSTTYNKLYCDNQGEPEQAPH